MSVFIMLGDDIMLGLSDIVKDSVVEFSRLQDCRIG